MISQRTQHLLVAPIMMLRGSLSLWAVPYLLLVWLFDGTPAGVWISGRLFWYLTCAIWAAFLLSITWGRPIRSVLVLAGLVLLDAGRFAGFMLWLPGLLLIVAVLLIESLPHIRTLFASFRESYRKISKMSET